MIRRKTVFAQSVIHCKHNDLSDNSSLTYYPSRGLLDLEK